MNFDYDAELTEMRFLFGPGGPHAIGAEASMLKIRGTELPQLVSELAAEALDYYAQPAGAGTGRAGLQRRPGRPLGKRLCLAQLLQPAGRLHLLRLQRDPAQHHRQGGARSVGSRAASHASTATKASSGDARSSAPPETRRAGFRTAHEKAVHDELHSCFRPSWASRRPAIGRWLPAIACADPDARAARCAA